jgi:hypothetical protein
MAGAVIFGVRLPRCEDFDQEVILPQAEGGRIGTHARCRAVEMVQRYHRQWRGPRTPGRT